MTKDTFNNAGGTDAYNFTQVFSKELLKGEKVLWAGQPEPTLFTGIDIFIVPFSLVWAGGMAYGIGSSLIKGDLSGSSSSPLPLFYSMFFLFAIMGIYFVFGRFIFKLWKKKNTYYGVTNQRILTVCLVPSKSIQAVYINQLPTLNQSVNSQGIGTLIFGNSSYPGMMYANTGLDFFSGFMNSVPAFFDIKDADKVYQLINDLRNQPQSQAFQ